MSLGARGLGLCDAPAEVLPCQRVIDTLGGGRAVVALGNALNLEQALQRGLVAHHDRLCPRIARPPTDYAPG